MLSVPDPETGLPVGLPVAGGPARLPDRATELVGRTVRLVPLDPAAHAEALWTAVTARGSETLWVYLPDGPYPDLATYRHHLDALAADPARVTLAILGPDGAPLGHASYMRMEPAQRVIEVGFITFSPALQRTPAATEAMALMAGHVFDDLGYRRYEWKCNALNAPSRRAALRLGFSYEGTFRNHMVTRGRNRDTAWFSITQSEWPLRRAAFERWLAPGNFDEAGRQQLALNTLNVAALEEGGVSLRRATLDDADAIAALQARAYAPNRVILGVEPVPLLLSGQEVVERYEAWLLEGHDGAPAALLALDPAPDQLTIWSVAVDPSRQRDGLGRQLLAAAETRARELGVSTLRLFTGEPLTALVAWYARHGYATERIEALPDRRLVHMTKTLESDGRNA